MHRVPGQIADALFDEFFDQRDGKDLGGPQSIVEFRLVVDLVWEIELDVRGAVKNLQSIGSRRQFPRNRVGGSDILTTSDGCAFAFTLTFAHLSSPSYE